MGSPATAFATKGHPIGAYDGTCPCCSGTCVLEGCDHQPPEPTEFRMDAGSDDDSDDDKDADDDADGGEGHTGAEQPHDDGDPTGDPGPPAGGSSGPPDWTGPSTGRADEVLDRPDAPVTAQSAAQPIGCLFR